MAEIIYADPVTEDILINESDEIAGGEETECNCCVECVEGEEPTAAFSWSQATFFPFRINLFDDSTVHANCTDGEIVEWKWYKNSETTPFSTVQNPTSVSMSAGDTIRLWVKDSCGCTDEVIGEFFAPCEDITTFFSTYQLILKLEGAGFANDPGTCCEDEWGDPGIVSEPGDGSSPVTCTEQIETYLCGPNLAYVGHFAYCVGDYLSVDVKLCNDGSPGWTASRSSASFPPFITIGTWYDLGIVTVTGDSSYYCYPGSGMRLYGKWV